MPFKTILVHVDDSAPAATRIALAATLALRHDAHLIGVAMTGVSRYFYQDANADLARTVLAVHMDALFHKAERALDQFVRVARGAGLASCEQRLIDDEAGAGLALAARYADLLVIGQSDPGAAAAPGGGELAGWLLAACPRPLLVVPYVQSEVGVGRRVLVAWNGSAEALRALTAALPVLRAADSVTLARFAEPGAALADEPELAAWLGRHGVQARVVDQATDVDVGDALISLAADLGADLLVMGAYGHTAWRELVLGGVTRTVLRTMTVPVLMAH